MTEVEFLKNFGANLEYELENAWMTQRDLADISGLNESTISRYIRGTCMPTLKNVINIAKALDCSVLDLIDTSEMII